MSFVRSALQCGHLRAAISLCRASPRLALWRHLSTSGDPPASLPSSGGWYSAESVERRLRRVRSRPPGGSGRTAPPPSEEDFWLASGAYDATLAASAAAADLESTAPRAAAQQSAADATEAAAAAAAEAAAWLPLPIARVSTGRVALSNVPAVVRSYELLLLPFYRSCSGCLRAELLLGGIPAGASRGTVLAAATGGGRSAVHVEAQSVTLWADESSLEAAQAREDYADAMRQLQTLFVDAPAATQWASVVREKLDGSGAG